ncbi:MAG: nucleotide pyrophosphohydrolase [Microlunatus sp.]|nr:nucleotide pyrophosphohydrolase [Microlunatus sp.]MDN5805401.1 nucleotide pyrophosphohydrolase [Microlunatus sp.]
MSDLRELRDAMRHFSRVRNWTRFHDPKSLILALVGEVGELSELFQWLPADQAAQQASTGDLQRRAADEMSDVLLYLVRLADVLEVDLGQAATQKLKLASEKYEPGDDPDRYRH